MRTTSQNSSQRSGKSLCPIPHATRQRTRWIFRAGFKAATLYIYNSIAYQVYIDALRKQRKFNANQLAVFHSAKSVYQRLASIAGLPVTGKTRPLRQLVTGQRYSDHTFLLSAPSNVAVDNDATEVYQNLLEDLRDTTRMLRVEFSSAEFQTILTQMNPDDFEDSEHTDPAKYKDLKDAADSPGLRKLNEDVDDVKKLYLLFQTSRRLENSNAPVGMTMGYRIWEIMKQCRFFLIKLYLHVLVGRTLSDLILISFYIYIHIHSV